MGFLLGAFGKLAAGRRVRQLQAKMMRIQSRLRRATRDASDMEKLINRQEKAALNNLNCSSMAAKNEIQENAYKSVFVGDNKTLYDKFKAGNESLSETEQNRMNNMFATVNKLITSSNATLSMNETMSKQQIEDYFEQLKELQLEPLKDEEELLQSEKDSLESQIQIAQQDYEACKEMEKSGAKMMQPSYTAST